MRTEFTLEETYQVWSEEVINAMTEEYQIARSIAKRIVLVGELKKTFMENPEVFDFMAIEKVAIWLYTKVREKDDGLRDL